MVRGSSRDRFWRRRRLMAVVAAVLAVGLVVGGIGLAANWVGGGSPTAPASTSPPDSSLAPGATPTGGISRADAIQIAASAASATPTELETASAEIRFGDSPPAVATNLWIWKVTFTTYGGPTGGRQAIVILDYFTGYVIDVRNAVA